MQKREFAIDTSKMRFREPAVGRYVEELPAGKDGPRGEDFHMRWVASMVADVFRVFTPGGIFPCPRDTRRQRVPVILGPRDAVERVVRCHA